MSSEPDLYPPDIEVVTKDIKTARDRAVIGTFLVTLGSGLMLERAFDNNLDYFWLAVGLGILAGWLQAPRFIWFAVGSIVTGFAVGGLVQSLISAPFESTIGFLFAAAGFFAVYARYPRNAKWAIIPAALFGLFAVGATGVELIGFIPSAITGMMLPLFLIAGGALLLFRNSLPRNFVKGGLVVLAIMFVGSAASTVDKWDTDPDFDFDFGAHRAEAVLPPIEGRTVVLDCAAGSVTVREGDAPFVSAEIQGAPRDLAVDVTETEIIVTTRTRGGPPILRNMGLMDCEVTLPRGTDIEATVGSGDINAVYGGGDSSYKTGSGDINVDVLDPGEGSLDLTTGSGDVELDLDDSELGPTLDLTTGSGEIEVDGDEQGETYVTEGSAFEIRVRTGSGDISVDQS